MGVYGVSVYGVGLYGVDAPPSSGVPIDIPITTACVLYDRFVISGVNLGKYSFDVNPSDYDPYPVKDTNSYRTIMDADPTIDFDYNKFEISLSWNRMPEQQFYELESFSRKNTDGRSENIYFWDGAIGSFNGAQIRVISFEAGAGAGFVPIDRTRARMLIRRVF